MNDADCKSVKTLLSPADLAVWSSVVEQRLEHVRKAEYAEALLVQKRLGSHAWQFLDLIESHAKRIEELERDLDWLDKKIGAFGDVGDGRTRITRLQAACHVLCHRGRIATQLTSERAAQAAAKKLEDADTTLPSNDGPHDEES